MSAMNLYSGTNCFRVLSTIILLLTSTTTFSFVIHHRSTQQHTSSVLSTSAITDSRRIFSNSQRKFSSSSLQLFARKQSVVEEKEESDRFSSNNTDDENEEVKRALSSYQDSLVELPYDGIMNFVPGQSYSRPADLADPILNPFTIDAASLPGEEGSPERTAALQQLIDDRANAVEEMTKSRKVEDLLTPIASAEPNLLISSLQDIFMISREGPPFYELFYFTVVNIFYLTIFTVLIFTISIFANTQMQWLITTDSIPRF